jgi:hypothetical protein
MNQPKFLKIFALCAFVVLLGASCWATVESLHLLLPDWPVILFWAVTVIFFVVASLGSKLIVDSFNQHDFVDNKGWRLIGGIVLMLAFWVCFSLPTNTHTFFYRASIKDLVIKDLQETKGKLQDLANDGEAGKIITQEKADFRNRINAIFSKFAAEINNPGNLGWADKAEAVIIELESELGKIQRLKLKCQSFQCRQELIKAMRTQVDNMMESRLNTVYKARLEGINRGLDKPTIQKRIAEIQKIQDRIDANKFDLTKSGKGSDIDIINQTLPSSYVIINKYSDVLISEFDKQYPNLTKIAKEDKNIYGGVSKTTKMLSVIDVWKDFFAGKYAGRGFIFWIIIAALVDIAGFIFFDIAFKKDEY